MKCRSHLTTGASCWGALGVKPDHLAEEMFARFLPQLLSPPATLCSLEGSHTMQLTFQQWGELSSTSGDMGSYINITWFLMELIGHDILKNETCQMRVHCPALFTVTLWRFRGSRRIVAGKTHFLQGGTKVNQLASPESREWQEVEGRRKLSCAWRRWQMLYMFAGQILNWKLWLSYQSTTDRNFQGVRLF